jgi:hypothetical protein
MSMSIPLKTDTRESYIARQKAEHLYWAKALFNVNGQSNYAMWCSLLEWVMAEDTYGEHWDKLNGVAWKTEPEVLKPQLLEPVDEGGLFDDIPIYNKARDKAWEAFIKRKDVKKSGMFSQGFPLEREYYELWCQAWDRAWTAGFKDGYDSGWASCKLLTAKTKEKNNG